MYSNKSERSDICHSERMKSLPREFEESLQSGLLSAVLTFPADPTRDTTHLENKIVFLLD